MNIARHGELALNEPRSSRAGNLGGAIPVLSLASDVLADAGTHDSPELGAAAIRILQGTRDDMRSAIENCRDDLVRWILSQLVNNINAVTFQITASAEVVAEGGSAFAMDATVRQHHTLLRMLRDMLPVAQQETVSFIDMAKVLSDAVQAGREGLSSKERHSVNLHAVLSVCAEKAGCTLTNVGPEEDAVIETNAALLMCLLGYLFQNAYEAERGEKYTGTTTQMDQPVEVEYAVLLHEIDGKKQMSFVLSNAIRADHVPDKESIASMNRRFEAVARGEFAVLEACEPNKDKVAGGNGIGLGVAALLATVINSGEVGAEIIPGNDGGLAHFEITTRLNASMQKPDSAPSQSEVEESSDNMYVSKGSTPVRQPRKIAYRLRTLRPDLSEEEALELVERCRLAIKLRNTKKPLYVCFLDQMKESDMQRLRSVQESLYKTHTLVTRLANECPEGATRAKDTYALLADYSYLIMRICEDTMNIVTTNVSGLRTMVMRVRRAMNDIVSVLAHLKDAPEEQKRDAKISAHNALFGVGIAAIPREMLEDEQHIYSELERLSEILSTIVHELDSDEDTTRAAEFHETLLLGLLPATRIEKVIPRALKAYNDEGVIQGTRWNQARTVPNIDTHPVLGASKILDELARGVDPEDRVDRAETVSWAWELSSSDKDPVDIIEFLNTAAEHGTPLRTRVDTM